MSRFFATQEAPTRDQEDNAGAFNASASYRMPAIDVGHTVRYYGSGQLHQDGRPECGIVLKVGHKTVSLLVMGQIYKPDVKHASDPRLKQSEEHRASGAWDYTDEWYELRDTLNDFHQRLADLEEGISPKGGEQSEAARKKAVDMGALRARANELGAENVRIRTREWLQQFIGGAESKLKSDQIVAAAKAGDGKNGKQAAPKPASPAPMRDEI